MGWGVTIDFDGYSVLHGTLSGTRALVRPGSAQMKFLGSTVVPTEGQRMRIFDSAPSMILGGVITSVTAERAGNTSDTIYTVEMQSWEARIALRVCGGKVYNADNCANAGAIIKDVFDTFANNELYFYNDVDGANVDAGISIADLGDYDVTGKTVLDVCNELAERSEYYFYMTPEAHIFFIPKAAALTGGPTINVANQNYADPQVVKTMQEYFNQVKVRIAWEAFTPTVNTYTANGVAVEWTLTHPLDNVVSLTVAGIEVTHGAESDTSVDFWVAYGSNKLKQNTANPVYTTEEISISYHKVGGNIVVVNDSTEIAARVAIEGGSGIYEAPLIDAENIIDQAIATQRGEAFLSKHLPKFRGATAGTAPSVYRFTFRSYEADASKIVPGYLITLNWTNPSSGGSKTLIVNSISFRDEGYHYYDRGNSNSEKIDGYLVYTVEAHEFVAPLDETQYLREILRGTGGGTTSRAPSGGGTGITVPASTTTIEEHTLTAASTTITTGVTALDGLLMVKVIKQDGTGGRDITWSSDFKLVQGFPIDYRQANTYSVFTFVGRTSDNKWLLCAMPITGVSYI